MRPSAKMLENRAYCVAENLRCVMRRSSTPKAPVAMPWQRFSSAIAPYMTKRWESGCTIAPITPPPQGAPGVR